MNLVGSLGADGDARVHVGDNHSNVHNYFAASSDEGEVKLRNDFLRRLNTTPYEERKDRNPERADGTCEWFTAHHLFQSWKREISAPLWVSANPGCGKSVLARYLVDEVLASNDTRRTCYFFFKDDFDDQKTAEGALRCILYQLFIQEPTLLSDDILSHYKHEKDQYLASFSKLWHLLLKAASRFEHGEIVCILDALDECEGHTSLTEALTQLYSQDSRPSGLKFILTSRPYREHRREFRDLVRSQPTIHLRGDGQEEANKIALEITIAIKRRTDDLCGRSPIFLQVREFLEQEIAKIDQRTYLWVDLVFNHLENVVLYSKAEVRSCIFDLPQTVEAAYEKILQKRAHPDKARKIFHLMMAAERPLSLAEMAVMLALRETHSCREDLERDSLSQDSLFDEIREACGLFVIIKDRKLFFLHQTAREFLLQLSDEPSTACWRQSIDLRMSQDLMATLCIRYLLFPEFGKVGRRWKDQKSIVFVEYAARYWTTHYRQARHADTHIQSLALHLCNADSPIAKVWLAAHNQVELSTSLLIVAYFGLADLVKRILDTKREHLNDKSSRLRTALSFASEQGHGSVVRLLLDQVPKWQVKLSNWTDSLTPAIVNRPDGEGKTPLWYASLNGHTDVVQQLLDMGANPGVHDKDGHTPFSCAISRGRKEVTALLIANACLQGSKMSLLEKLHGRDRLTPLLVAARSGNEIMVRLLLDSHGANTAAADRDGKTALMYASIAGSLETAKLLLGHGAGIHATSAYGKTALMYASRAGSLEITKLLLDHGADINGSDETSTTALIHALASGDLETAKLLLAYGADINACDNAGKTALMYASLWGQLETAELLLDHGASVDSSAANGQRPLSFASEHGHHKTAKLLLDRGADVNAADRCGKTALLYALEEDHDETLNLLLDHGANFDAWHQEAITRRRRPFGGVGYRGKDSVASINDADASTDACPGGTKGMLERIARDENPDPSIIVCPGCVRKMLERIARDADLDLSTLDCPGYFRKHEEAHDPDPDPDPDTSTYACFGCIRKMLELIAHDAYLDSTIDACPGCTRERVRMAANSDSSTAHCPWDVRKQEEAPDADPDPSTDACFGCIKKRLERIVRDADLDSSTEACPKCVRESVKAHDPDTDPDASTDECPGCTRKLGKGITRILDTDSCSRCNMVYTV